ncbi:hypothetical protein SAMN04488109_1887 [Chryseolinea serpens]|uniref:Uncharacterized protein n=1 Tax=Chryseolinea serpens TaxID=947013 RepID=A0A1M5MR36_9BACT|nr:hypothetical protein [Chryseolinea serpens]SHG79768.1 hypothetical protein SAMN04488109_1887 [Chryseolinea serpens]
MTTLFFDKVGTATVGATIFFVLFILLCYAMFGMMSYRFKVIIMTGKELIVIKPFRLQYKRFKFDSIKSLKWDLWEIHRMPDFRKLNILTTSGDRLNISDLEFVNYDNLEKWLIENTNVELNLDWKRNVEVRQARYNRWINLVTIVIMFFFFFLFSTGHRGNNATLAIRIAIVIVTWRLLVQLIRYQKRIATSGRKKR